MRCSVHTSTKAFSSTHTQSYLPGQRRPPMSRTATRFIMSDGDLTNASSVQKYSVFRLSEFLHTHTIHRYSLGHANRCRCLFMGGDGRWRPLPSVHDELWRQITRRLHGMAHAHTHRRRHPQSIRQPSRPPTTGQYYFSRGFSSSRIN